MRTRKPTKRDRIRDHITAVVFLTLVWNLLWGAFTWANLITGILVAVAVLVFFPLPPVVFVGRLRPIGLIRFALRFIADLVVASVQVAMLAFRFGRHPTSAIVAVPLRIHSDLNMTLVGEAVSLVPGSLIVEADRRTATLYIHMLGVEDHEHLERLRKDVWLLEDRIARALGSDEELRRCGIDPSERKEPRP
ncbi:MAG TPA: Na+/H+ antiporter subunit E [Glycomyces sp.]|nr:Na+/H+ antiporter subunit E [Glycomyces sp.]